MSTQNQVVVVFSSFTAHLGGFQSWHTHQDTSEEPWKGKTPADILALQGWMDSKLILPTENQEWLFDRNVTILFSFSLVSFFRLFPSFPSFGSVLHHLYLVKSVNQKKKLQSLTSVTSVFQVLHGIKQSHPRHNKLLKSTLRRAAGTPSFTECSKSPPSWLPSDPQGMNPWWWMPWMTICPKMVVFASRLSWKWNMDSILKIMGCKWAVTIF